MEQEKKLIFEKMTPTDNCDISVYQDAIDFVFNENDVKNVAISGAYGSGKSSVLETYKKNHPKYHFLHISLAHFQSNNGTTERKADEGATAKKSVSIESILEGKILNQLIHQIPLKIFRKPTLGSKKLLTRQICGFIRFFSLYFFFRCYILSILILGENMCYRFRVNHCGIFCP